MATGATEFIDNTTADAFIPEIWSQEAIVARKQRLVFAQLVNGDFSREVMKYGDTIIVPSRGHLASRTKSANTAITYETVTESNTQITIATWEYAAIALESLTKTQANRDMLSFYAGEMGYALDLAIDDVLAGLVDDFTQTVGTLAVGLTYADLLEARQYLDDANAPQESRAIVVAPNEEANLLQLDHFIHTDYAQNLGAEKGNGPDRAFIGRWMGMPVYKSTNVEGSNSAGHDNTMLQREALALVVQMKPTSHHMYDIDYFADKVAMEHVHGSREMRDDHGVWLKGG